MKNHRLWIIRIILTVAAAAVIGFIFIRSMQNADDSAAESGSILEWISGILRSMGIDAELSDHFIRKAAHFTEYFVLGALLSFAAYSYVLKRKKMLMITLPAGLIVAVSDELIQLGSEGRSCEIGDMALDFSAVVTAALLVTLILYGISRRRMKKQGKKEGLHNE